VQQVDWVERWQGMILLHRVKIRFFFTGILNTVVGLGTFPALYYLLESRQFHYLVILTITQVLCICFAYLTNKFLVFKTKGNYANEFSKFITFHLSYFAINLVMLPLMVIGLNFNPVIAQTLFAVTVIVSSYFWHSRITFSPN
jgi:putative flippase GtrA